MTKWYDLLGNDGKVPEWPYPILYDHEQEIDTDVLIIGGGLALLGNRSAINQLMGYLLGLTMLSAIAGHDQVFASYLKLAFKRG